MSFFEITGGRRLSGSIVAQGAKNSVLPILAACVLGRGVSVIENCPRLSDVEATLDILRRLGCTVERRDSTVTVDARDVSGGTVPAELMERTRSSVIFLGAILARTGQAQMTYPGGCELGPRPIDLHLQGLRAQVCGSGRNRASFGVPWSAVCVPVGSDCPFPVWVQRKMLCWLPAERRELL